ncbi:MAG: hypothetical protein HY043_10165 [Verrucomicrobia bacterium]|nr:hypothetical protein [Verrucomicrobiota bacterium]
MSKAIPIDKQRLLGSGKLKAVMKFVRDTRLLPKLQSFFKCGLHTLVVARKQR